MKRTRAASTERGAMLMELAIMLPLLVLLIMLVLEGSNLIRTHQVLNNAAREGARLSVIKENQGHTDDIANEVVAYANANGVPIAASNVTIDQGQSIPTPSGVSMSASLVTVTYTYNVTYLSAFAWLGVPSSYSLSGSAEFRNFYI